LFLFSTIMTAEILGGAALLLPWRWLTLAAVAGLTIDMAGALYTQMRIRDSLDAITLAIVMVARLAALALLAMRGRWVPVAVGAVGCIAGVGGSHRYAEWKRAIRRHGAEKNTCRPNRGSVQESIGCRFRAAPFVVP
jgi:DoxX-like family